MKYKKTDKIESKSKLNWLEQYTIFTGFSINPDKNWQKMSKLFSNLKLTKSKKNSLMSNDNFENIQTLNAKCNKFLKNRNIHNSTSLAVFCKLSLLINNGYARENFSFCLCTDIFLNKKMVLIFHTSLGDLFLDDCGESIFLWFDAPYNLLAIESVKSATGWVMVLPRVEDIKKPRKKKTQL